VYIPRKSSAKSSSSIYYTPPIPIIPYPILPKKGGRGTSGWGGFGVGKRYKFRKFKVESLFK